MMYVDVFMKQQISISLPPLLMSKIKSVLRDAARLDADWREYTRGRVAALTVILARRRSQRSKNWPESATILYELVGLRREDIETCNILK